MEFKKGDCVGHTEFGTGTVRKVMPNGLVCVRFTAGVADVKPDDLTRTVAHIFDGFEAE